MQLHKNVKILSWLNFFSDFRLYAPIAILYFQRVTGSFALGMSIFSIIMVSSALFELPTGIFSDKIGRRKTVIYGALSAVLFSIFYAIGHSYWILVIGALFEGLSRSFYSGNNDALLYDSLAETHHKDEFHEYLGKTSSMDQTGLAISAVLGALIVTISFPLIMWLSVIPQIICVVLSLRLIEPTIHLEKTTNIYAHLKEAFIEFVKNKKLRTLSFAYIIGYGIGESNYQFQAAFFSTLWPVWAINIIKTIGNVGASASFYFSGRIIKRFGALTTMFASNFYFRIIGILAVAFPTFISPVLMTSSSLLFGVTTVARNTLFQMEFKDRTRATMGSLNSFGGSIFFGLVALSTGFLADTFSPAKALLIFQIIMIMQTYLYWKLFHHERHSAAV